ncbi:FecR family protein [Bacteroides sp. 4_1_36]|uniref:FecR family protein n=1 Tax=Bacteroides sp. 4_1_36 TaxID=457393 RepID=UPI0002FB734E|nr:FecR family protein [Bacteroides sp. 4_1_36]
MMINEDYFIKYLKNELTEEETRQLIAWVKEKKENQDFLFSLKDSYVYLNYENDCKEADTEHEWQKFAQRTGLSQQAGTPPKKKNVSWRRFFLYAAVVVVVAFVGWQANAYYSGISSSVELVTLETEVGQQARTVLPDGSTVLLNACSKLTYSLGGCGKHAVYSWREKRYSM